MAHANSAENGGSDVAAMPAVAGERTFTAVTARKNGRSVPTSPTPRTDQATGGAASLPTGHDHHGSTIDQNATATRNP